MPRRCAPPRNSPPTFKRSRPSKSSSLMPVLTWHSQTSWLRRWRRTTSRFGFDRRDLPFARQWQEELVEMVRLGGHRPLHHQPRCDWLDMVRVGTRPGCKVPKMPRADRLSAGRERPHSRGTVAITADILRPARRLRYCDRALAGQFGTDIDWVRQHTDLADAARDWRLADQSARFSASWSGSSSSAILA